MKIVGSREGEHRGWPGYLFGGRMRTSTFALILAFMLTWWLYDTYQPAPPPAPAQPAVVPPGFVPDPDYTWVPRTSVRTAPPTTTTRRTTTTTTTTTTTPSETTTETSTTPTSTEPGAPTTVVDPDGPGPLSPTTVVDPDGPGPLPPTVIPPTSTVPNRSGIPAITLPTPEPFGPATTPTTPPPAP